MTQHPMQEERQFLPDRQQVGSVASKCVRHPFQREEIQQEGGETCLKSNEVRRSGEAFLSVSVVDLHVHELEGRQRACLSVLKGRVTTGATEANLQRPFLFGRARAVGAAVVMPPARGHVDAAWTGHGER